jgi:hypothetical protein
LATASDSPDVFLWQMILHGASILASIAHHEAQGPTNNASFSMIFPVKLLCLLSPSETQRDIAREALTRWGESRGLTSACEIAPSFMDRSHG